MISLDYINNTKGNLLLFSPEVKIERELDAIMDEMEVAYQEYVSAVNLYELDATFLEKDDVDDKKKEAVESTGKNFVSQLGASVIAMFKKAIAYITDIIGKIKAKFGTDKEKISKADAICKQNPKLKEYLVNEVKDAIDNGDMSITDIKALAELDRSYEELVELAKKKDYNPDSLKGKWEAAKKKFEGSSKTPIIAGVVGIASVITALGAANKVLEGCKSNMNDGLEKMYTFDRLSSDSTTKTSSADWDNKGALRLLADAARYNSGAHIKAANEANSITVLLAKLIDSVIVKVSPSTADNMKKNVTHHAQQLNSRKTIENDRK